MSCNQSTIGLNLGQGESKLIMQLCNCETTNKHWCFVHNRVLKPITETWDNGVNDFGFIAESIPRNPLFRPAREIKAETLKQWACKAHVMVRNSGCYNYMGERIRVPTELNIYNWRSLCGNYNDQLLLNYLEFGFPLCVNRASLHFNSHVENHPSAVNYPHDVDVYFDKELSHQAIVGPFEEIPFPVHYSPLLSRPKPDDTRRIIANLSFPYGASLNDCISDGIYDNVPFQLKYPVVQDIVDKINELNSDVLLSKIDISRAFRNLRIDPHDFDLLGLTWRNTSYLDLSVPMGMKSGSALCQRVTDVLRHIMRSKNVTPLQNLSFCTLCLTSWAYQESCTPIKSPHMYGRHCRR